MDLATIGRLARSDGHTATKIVLVVLDGLGGLPERRGGQTELERARTPNLDRLAGEAECGLHVPVVPGITPGSGPGHLALFGYDPLTYDVGRGVLSALGIGFELQAGDVAARGNFCSVDPEGVVTDRRAGRISTEKNEALCRELREISVPGVELHVQTIKEHRFLLVLRGEGLSDDVADTDPQATGRLPERPRALSDGAGRTADAVEAFLDGAAQRLSGHEPANMVLLRGFASRPDWPTVGDVFGLRALAVAAYPMYRGVARLVGMQAESSGERLEETVAVAARCWSDFDYFFLHVKAPDSAGEDGDFRRKVAAIEEADAALTGLLALEPDVLVVTGDHSTPAIMRRHSWHPVPVLLWSGTGRGDGVAAFGERACMTGALGRALPGKDLMVLALAHAGRLEKYGA